MNKTVTITLNKIIFHIEEDAYSALREYLDSIKNYFKKTEGSDEMLADIEISIAEKFSKKTKSKKGIEVIVLNDVEEMIEVMGKVEDFAGEALLDESDSETVSPAFKSSKNSESDSGDYGKKLYRNPDDVIIGGVCSGLAEYFGIDAVFVRLIFVIGLFFWGSTFWIYLVLWLVMPMAKTASQKLEMRGNPVTLKKLEESLKRKVKESATPENKEKINSVFRKIINFFTDIFRSIFSFLGKIFPFLRILVGLMISLGSIFAIAGLLFLTGVALFKINSPYLNPDFPINQIVGEGVYRAWVASLFFAAVIPAIAVLLLGAGIARKKNFFNFLNSGILFSVWLLFLISFGIIAVDAVPKISYEAENYITKHQTVKDYELNTATSSIEKIIIDGDLDVDIINSEFWAMNAKGKDSDIENLVLENGEGDILRLSKKETKNDFCLFCREEALKIELSGPGFEKLEALNQADVVLSGFPSNDFDLKLDDYARLEIVSGFESGKATGSRLFVDMDDRSGFYASELIAESAEFKLDDYAKASIEGRVRELKLDLESGSRFEGFDFVAGSIDLNINNFSRALLEVEDSLKVKAKNNSIIQYRGEPELEIEADENSSINGFRL